MSFTTTFTTPRHPPARPTGIAAPPVPPLPPRPYSQSTYYRPPRNQQLYRPRSRASTTVHSYNVDDVELTENATPQQDTPTGEAITPPSAPQDQDNVVTIRGTFQDGEYVDPTIQQQQRQAVGIRQPTPFTVTTSDTASLAAAALAAHNTEKGMQYSSPSSPVSPTTAAYLADEDVNQSAPYPICLFYRTSRWQMIPNFQLISMTNLIIIACTGVFVAELLVGQYVYDGAFVSSNYLGGPSVATLYHMGGKWEPDVRGGAVWRLLTALFLHVGVVHIVMNMSALAVVGYTFEQRWHWYTYLIVFLVSGILGNMWSCVNYPGTLGVGASGGIMGLLGADISYVLYNYRLVPMSTTELISIVVIAGVTVGFGFLSIINLALDNFAHLGGVCCGAALGFCLLPFPEKRALWIEILVRLGGALTTIGLYVLFAILLWIGNPNGPTDVSNF